MSKSAELFEKQREKVLAEKFKQAEREYLKQQNKQRKGN